MSWKKCSGSLLLGLVLILMAEAALAFTVQPRVQFDSNSQEFFLYLNLPECEYTPGQTRKGNVTQYVTVTGVDRYTVSQRYYSLAEVRGPFKASTLYSIKVDGRICGRSGEFSGSVYTGKYPAGVQFLSKVLYFSKMNPYLHFRH